MSIPASRVMARRISFFAPNEHPTAEDAGDLPEPEARSATTSSASTARSSPASARRPGSPTSPPSASSTSPTRSASSSSPGSSTSGRTATRARSTRRSRTASSTTSWRRSARAALRVEGTSTSAAASPPRSSPSTASNLPRTPERASRASRATGARASLARPTTLRGVGPWEGQSPSHAHLCLFLPPPALACLAALPLPALPLAAEPIRRRVGRGHESPAEPAAATSPALWFWMIASVTRVSPSRSLAPGMRTAFSSRSICLSSLSTHALQSWCRGAPGRTGSPGAPGSARGPWW